MELMTGWFAPGSSTADFALLQMTTGRSDMPGVRRRKGTFSQG